jgi:hypothetical protein
MHVNLGHLQRADASYRCKQSVLARLRRGRDIICIAVWPAWPARPTARRILSFASSGVNLQSVDTLRLDRIDYMKVNCIALDWIEYIANIA